MSSRRSKGADEIYCRSCGDVIKRAAEICPHCGVRNQEAPTTSGTASSTSVHDPAQYDTTVSSSWYWGVAGAVLVWVVALVIFSIEPGPPLEDIAALFVLGAWILMPIAVYFDAKYVRANSRWNPGTALWVIGTLFWFVNVVVGAVYLYRRREAIGAP